MNICLENDYKSAVKTLKNERFDAMFYTCWADFYTSCREDNYMMDEKKYTVSELLMYYVDRYRLTGDPYTIMTCLKKGEIEGYKTTRVYLERLLKKTKIGEVFLWDAVKQPDGVRRISISEFERLCFRKWAGYIQTRYPECDMDALQADIYRYNETYRWDDEARKIIEAQNRSLETGEYTSDEEDRIYEGVVISDAEVRQKGLEMMIEAIWNVVHRHVLHLSVRADDAVSMALCR